MFSTSAPAETASSRRWLAPGPIAAAQFMVIMDTSIVGVATPEMQADLGFTPEGDHDLLIACLTDGVARDSLPGLDRIRRASDAMSRNTPQGYAVVDRHTGGVEMMASVATAAYAWPC